MSQRLFKQTPANRWATTNFHKVISNHRIITGTKIFGDRFGVRRVARKSKDEERCMAMRHIFHLQSLRRQYQLSNPENLNLEKALRDRPWRSFSSSTEVTYYLQSLITAVNDIIPKQATEWGFRVNNMPILIDPDHDLASDYVLENKEKAEHNAGEPQRRADPVRRTLRSSRRSSSEGEDQQAQEFSRASQLSDGIEYRSGKFVDREDRSVTLCNQISPDRRIQASVEDDISDSEKGSNRSQSEDLVSMMKLAQEAINTLGSPSAASFTTAVTRHEDDTHVNQSHRDSAGRSNSPTSESHTSEVDDTVGSKQSTILQLLPVPPPGPVYELVAHHVNNKVIYPLSTDFQLLIPNGNPSATARILFIETFRVRRKHNRVEIVIVNENNLIVVAPAQLHQNLDLTNNAYLIRSPKNTDIDEAIWRIHRTVDIRVLSQVTQLMLSDEAGWESLLWSCDQHLDIEEEAMDEPVDELT